MGTQIICGVFSPVCLNGHRSVRAAFAALSPCVVDQDLLQGPVASVPGGEWEVERSNGGYFSWIRVRFLFFAAPPGTRSTVVGNFIA